MRIRKIERSSIALLLLAMGGVLLGASGSFAATYHVAPPPLGSDANPGTEAAPWATLQAAANRVVAGDTVLVADGSYSPFHIVQSGTASARITFQAKTQNANVIGYESFDGRFAAITVLGDYTTLEGFKVDVGAVDASVLSRGIRVSGADGAHRRGVIIKNNTVKNAGWVGITTSFAEGIIIENNDVSNSKGQHGIYVANSADNPIVRGNRVSNNNNAGIQINADVSVGGDGVITNALIENNILFGNGISCCGAIELDGAAFARIHNNLLYNNKTTGINNYRADGAQASHDNAILNNTIVMPAGSRHGIAFRNGSTGSVLRNNIVLHEGTGDSLAVDASSLTGLDSNSNILTRIEDPQGILISLSQWQAIFGQDLNSFIATSGDLFVSPSAADFQLKPGSPAIDAGVTVSTVTTDLLGVTRPQGSRYDIGAYEKRNSDTTPPNPPTGVTTK